MTDKQSNYLDMFQVVNAFHADNATALDAVPARAAAFGLLSTRITAINALASTQTGNITGIAADKAALRNALDQLSFTHLTAALAWARNLSNNTLAAEFDYTLWDIQKVKDDTVIAFCEHRYQLIDANSAALADYGILPATLTAWQTAMTAYAPLVAGPRSARVSRKVLTSQIASLFKQTNDHLRNILDPLMLALRASQPELYLGYQASRIIIDRKGPGNGPTPPAPLPQNGLRIAGTVRSQNGNTGIPNALVRAYNAMQGPGAGTMEVFTAADGSYLLAVDDLPEPMTIYMEVSAAGYPSQGRNLNVAPGQTYEGEDFNL